jgi:DNA/RNA non-specific endonuclease.
MNSLLLTVSVLSTMNVGFASVHVTPHVSTPHVSTPHVSTPRSSTHTTTNHSNKTTGSTTNKSKSYHNDSYETNTHQSHSDSHWLRNFFIFNGLMNHSHNHATRNTSDIKTLADKAISPVKSQFGQLRYDNGSYVIAKATKLNANVNSAPYATNKPNDKLGRAVMGDALLNKSTRIYQSRDKTGNTQTIKPVGFMNKRINGTYVYNRGHLLGYALVGGLHKFNASEANRQNIVTQTAWANQSQSTTAKGQNYYEGIVRKALDQNKTVRYRVTPVYNGNELVPRAMHMEAKSRDGKINFNVLVPNVQPKITIAYTTGLAR